MFPIERDTTITVSNIKWDIDNDADGNILPIEVLYRTPSRMDDLEELEFEVSEWLSDEWGFCHQGFSLEVGTAVLDVMG